MLGCGEAARSWPPRGDPTSRSWPTSTLTRWQHAILTASSARVSAVPRAQRRRHPLSCPNRSSGVSANITRDGGGRMAGGPGTKLMREDSRVIEIVKRHAAAKKTMAAICAAPTVLKVAVSPARRARRPRTPVAALCNPATPLTGLSSKLGRGCSPTSIPRIFRWLETCPRSRRCLRSYAATLSRLRY